MNRFKALKLKILLRLFVMFDVLLSEKFELTIWDKEGNQKSKKTTFSKSEINNKIDSKTL